MKLYDNTSAPSPRLVRIFAAEKGIDLELEPIELTKGEHKTPAFRAMNPLARIPVLELDDGTCISETIAICRYLEAIQPQPPLFGTDAKDQAIVEMWRRRIENEILIPIAGYFRNCMPFFKGMYPQFEDFGEANKKLAFKRLNWLNDELANREFIAGDRLSIADIQAVCAIEFGRASQIVYDPEEHAHLRRWHKGMRARPSASA